MLNVLFMLNPSTSYCEVVKIPTPLLNVIKVETKAPLSYLSIFKSNAPFSREPSIVYRDI